MKSKENSMSVKKSITDKSGFSKIQWCILLVVLALIMAFILSYVVAINIAQSQKKIATQALDAFVEDNAIRIYSEVKQNSDYTEELLEDEFLKKLVETNGLEAYGTDKYVCKSADGRNTQYVITKPEMDFEEDYSAKVIIEYIISVPLEFNGRPAIWVDIPITVTSRFMPKYEAEEEQKDSDDRTPPSITISIPSGTTEANPFVTPYDTVTVMGSVYDQELAMVAVAGDRISVTDGGAFKQIIDLQDGMNVIPVVATDRMGNTSTKYVYVSKEGVIPLDVTVEDYNGVYDGNPHSITVTCAQNAIITYSATEDGSYTNVNPTFTNAGTYRVYYRVEKEGYGTVQNSATVYIEKAENIFRVSDANGSTITMKYPGARSTFVIENVSGGKVTAVSNDTSLVIVTQDSDQGREGWRIGMTVQNKSGVATITITTAETANYKAATWILYCSISSCAHESLAFGEGYKAATCTEAGYSGDTYCMTCGDLIESGSTVAALGHDYSAQSTDDAYLRTSASCTAAATYYHKCSRCTSKGTTYWTHGSASGHNWSGRGTQRSAATCTANSTTWKTCGTCGTQSTTDYWTNSDALGHDYSVQGSLYSNATCTAPAYYYKKCSRCSNESGTMAVGNALGHNNTAAGALRSNATCTAAATYWYNCSRCGAQSSSYYSSGNALGHADPGVSCTENRYCARGCGTLYHYAAGHTGGSNTCTAGAVCTRCGVTYGSALGHIESGTVGWGNYDANYHYLTCSRCNTRVGFAHTKDSGYYYDSEAGHYHRCTRVDLSCWAHWNASWVYNQSTPHEYKTITSTTSTQHTKRCTGGSTACWRSVTENHSFTYTSNNASTHKAVCSLGICSYTTNLAHSITYKIAVNFHTPRCLTCGYTGTAAQHIYMINADGGKSCGVCGKAG